MTQPPVPDLSYSIYANESEFQPTRNGAERYRASLIEVIVYQQGSYSLQREVIIECPFHDFSFSSPRTTVRVNFKKTSRRHGYTVSDAYCNSVSKRIKRVNSTIDIFCSARWENMDTGAITARQIGCDTFDNFMPGANTFMRTFLSIERVLQVLCNRVVANIAQEVESDVETIRTRLETIGRVEEPPQNPSLIDRLIRN